ncbi:MAG TPA: hypothetical protein VN618_04580 [Solirubrobacteraceae bacterium]|nr:hypothetical protein [Solirubrobacteraceae bacterium]
MLESETAAIIAGASAIGGGAIVAVSNYAVSRRQSRDARQANLERVLIDLYDVLQQIHSKLYREPQLGRTEVAINRTMASRAPLLHDGFARIRRRLLEPEMDRLALSISRALSAAAIVAPLSMLGPVGRLTDLMQTADERDEKWWADWNAARTDYFIACREIVGSGLGPGVSSGAK